MNPDAFSSEEMAEVLRTAFNITVYESMLDGHDPFFDTNLEVAKVRYKAALRRLKYAYPGEVFCGLSECSWGEIAQAARDLERWGRPSKAWCEAEDAWLAWQAGEVDYWEQ